MFRFGMSRGALTIAEFPAESVELFCPTCDRRGRYAESRLEERYGGELSLPDLLRTLSLGCPARGRRASIGACGAIYPALRMQESLCRPVHRKG
jgi:hypothetical protein